MDINNLQPWSDYWRRNPLLFPTPNVARHFIDRRKERMKQMGIVIETTRGFIVDAKALDLAMVELWQSVDEKAAA